MIIFSSFVHRISKIRLVFTFLFDGKSLLNICYGSEDELNIVEGPGSSARNIEAVNYTDVIHALEGSCYGKIFIKGERQYKTQHFCISFSRSLDFGLAGRLAN